MSSCILRQPKHARIAWHQCDCTVGRQEWHGMAVNLVKIFCKRLSFMCPNSSKFIQHRLRLIIQLIRHCWGLGPIYTHNIHIYSIHQLNLVQPYSICLLIIKLHSLLVCLSSYVLTVHHSVTSWVPHSNGTGPLCKLLLYSEHQRNTHKRQCATPRTLRWLMGYCWGPNSETCVPLQGLSMF